MDLYSNLVLDLATQLYPVLYLGHFATLHLFYLLSQVCPPLFSIHRSRPDMNYIHNKVLVESQFVVAFGKCVGVVVLVAILMKFL